jgi:hypothetical protein
LGGIVTTIADVGADGLPLTQFQSYKDIMFKFGQ